jgi:hypothetical protein
MDVVAQSILLMAYGSIAFAVFAFILFALKPEHAPTARPGPAVAVWRRRAITTFGFFLFLSSIAATTAGLFMVQPR